VFTHKDTEAWAWLATGIGSRFPSVHGLYGGYGCPAIPAGRIKNTDVFETMEENPDALEYDIPDLMDKKPLDGDYTTWDLGLQQELAEEGEVYWMTQGAGGGLGDPIERDPESVLEDFEKELISGWVLENIYHVAYDEDTMLVNEEETEALRDAKREERLEEGVPFDEFVDDWETETPPATIPYFGSWNDEEEIYAGWLNQRMSPEELEPIPMNFLRTKAPALFDTPTYPPTPEYIGDVKDD
jgi:hypothetical protein